MRIQRLVLDHVACFDHLEIEFRPGHDPRKADIHLVVGANGTGKSTVLMAMAQCFSAIPTGLEKRLLGPEAYSLVEFEGAAATAVSFFDDTARTLTVGDSNESMSLARRSGPLAFFDAPVDGHTQVAMDAYRRLANEFQPFASQFRDVAFSYIAAAYGGRRSVEGYTVDGIVEQKGPPLQDACLVPKPKLGQKPEPLLQWIANTKAKAAFAIERSDSERHKRYSDVVGRVESVVSTITRRHFRFVLSDEPINVSVSIDGDEVPFDVLPDGLISLVSWIGDLLMRLDRVPWSTKKPLLEREMILFLDEIEIHLHPAWQRQILPVVQELFPNAQVFVSTHSPFIIASADDAWIYPLHLDECGRGYLGEVLPSMVGNSYATVLRDVLGIEAEFAPQVDERLKEFYALRDRALQGEPGSLERLKVLGAALGHLGEEVLAIVLPEIRQVERRLTGTNGKSKNDS